MADIRQDFTRTTQDLTRIAQDAAYVAIGLGVLGVQKAQVARRELMEQIDKQAKVGENPFADVRTQLAKAWKEIDKSVDQLIERADDAFEPFADRLPDPAKDVVKQVREVRDQVVDQVRDYLNQQLAA